MLFCAGKHMACVGIERDSYGNKFLGGKIPYTKAGKENYQNKTVCYSIMTLGGKIMKSLDNQKRDEHLHFRCPC
jgi:hypothetical protein